MVRGVGGVGGVESYMHEGRGALSVIPSGGGGGI